MAEQARRTGLRNRRASAHGGSTPSARTPQQQRREDTRARGLVECDDPACTRCPRNFEPQIILELADCYRQIELEFELDSEKERANSLHKLDTLLADLRVFRKGLVDEFDQYDRRERELDASRE